MVSDEIQRLKAKMDGLVREQADRRAMLERQGEEIKAKSQEYMTKQVQAAERYVQHRRELGRREREAGGWGTEKTLAEKNTVMGFGPEGDEAGRRAPEPYSAPTTESIPSPPPETTERTPAPRQGRHTRKDDFDEDDFSNNSWLG
ncbi:hypothetical protein LWP59_03355 [Amycolatopsis acidiphila]|uniref:Uncharacterized protein n=1 Tax=Amycolatopsis acidiphila TaxID=715473 RepID=A0A557ZP68_9PSEU|nr:hypothetical protein [Amycolatopsis acidiphila]TVT13824.1 hypothetical protein FNH06_38640 [Amycolatopsis acidiphila]UIJ60734.1 hypothetical protein LWP59_03355 [Amycolatopsis acidiphila]GHG91137.1 hypothetical protein GCM10017788_67170 [Amycolatopsis acidiphila]